MRVKIAREKQKSSTYKEKCHQMHDKIVKVKETLKALAVKGVDIDIHDEFQVL